MRNPALALLLLAGTAQANPVSPGVFGDWLTEDGMGVIRVAACGTEICGTIAGMTDHSGRDWRGLSQCGLTFIRVHRVEGEARLHGTVTDPQTGKVYQAELWLGQDGALRLRGYVGLEILGSTERWPAFRGTVGPGCAIQK